MRFSVPRSLSPSPVRTRARRNQSTFGLRPDSDESDTPSSSGSGSDSDDSFCYASESEVPPPPIKKRAKIKTTAEQRHIEDTVAAIRLRTRHHDPYEEWEKQTRKDAFRTARKKQTAIQVQIHHEQDQARIQESRRLAAVHAQQMAEVQAQLDSLKLQQQREEEKLRQGWQARDKQLWQRIDYVIQLEEAKVRARLEAEQKEEERRTKEEEDKRKAEEDRLKAIEDAERARVAEEKRNDDEEKQRVQDEKDKLERTAAEAEQRKAAGLTSAEDDWRNARSILMVLKTKTMRPIKVEKAARAIWGEHRRKITPKIGQLTNDSKAIREITDFIHDKIIMPPQRHPPILYTGLLSSLAKTILLQAETEVTAEKKSAIPLAQVAFTLLDRLETFPDIFFAKLVQRCGGWPIPVVIPTTDYDGRKWNGEEERTKVMGYRKTVEEGDAREGVVEYTNRVAGLMRLYFHILKLPPQRRPLHAMFQLPRYWTWFARLMGEPGLLETSVAAQLIYTALDVLGSHALEVWGNQWVKMLELVYEGVTVGMGGGRFIGGSSPEGQAARARVQMEVERIMAGAR
ncbi:GLE1-like protein-domain-containing protein [Mycena rebaudengoi]|nr:GLE1-like protein-domain-containing protein [Mycena rebaudengoi]